MSDQTSKTPQWYGSGYSAERMPSSEFLRDSARTIDLRFVVSHSVTSLTLGAGALYVDCPVHGPGRPFAAERPGVRMINGSYIPWGSTFDIPMAVAGDAYGAPTKMLLCPVCWAWVPFRQITIRGHGASGRPCGGACTSGKRSCDCKCNGLCHGAGRCYCKGQP
jgi:hypothetical protein